MINNVVNEQKCFHSHHCFERISYPAECETFRTRSQIKGRSVLKHQSQIDYLAAVRNYIQYPSHLKMSTIEQVWGNLSGNSTSSASRTSYGNGGSNSSYSSSLSWRSTTSNGYQSWGSTNNSSSYSWGNGTTSSASGRSKDVSSVWGKLW